MPLDLYVCRQEMRSPPSNTRFMSSHSSNISGKRRAGDREIKFWRIPRLGNLELLHGDYAAQGFPRHMHEEYILGVMVRGVEALRHQGATYFAPAGSVLMINPGEWHANYAPDEAGFAFRT